MSVSATNFLETLLWRSLILCDLHEWPVASLHRSTGIYATAAIFLPRARAARI